MEILAPLSASAGSIAREGESRMSSVSGLKVSPSTAIFLPDSEPPSASRILATILAFCAALTSTTDSTMRQEAPCSCAMRISASVSLGKHEPPYPGPACKNFLPIRPSSPMPLATECTSAPTFSHSCDISLMKLILVARNALEAYLISSALSRLVTCIGASIKLSGR